MHIFMHKGHGGYSHDGHQRQDAEQAHRRGFEEGRKESGRHP
jgi:hypothetical protein